MAGPRAGEVREYLAAVRNGTGGDPALFALLAERGAVTGSPTLPSLTGVGQHVLEELSLRASRTDGMELDRLSLQMGEVMAQLDQIARSGEQFLGDVGPLVPTEILPLLRPVAIGLANRGLAPEELAERFRSTWAMAEAMPGDPADRLLGAELLAHAAASTYQLLGPIMRTADALGSEPIRATRPVSVATFLHLYPAPRAEAPVTVWQRWRATAGSEEGAALLAAANATPERFAAFRAELTRLGAKAGPDIHHAAALLLTASPQREPDFAEIGALAALWPIRPRFPLLTSAVLRSRHPGIPAAELADWVRKASVIAAQRRFATTPEDLQSIGFALVQSLSPECFGEAGCPTEPGEEPGLLPGVLAAHAWIHRATPETSR